MPDQNAPDLPAIERKLARILADLLDAAGIPCTVTLTLTPGDEPPLALHHLDTIKQHGPQLIANVNRDGTTWHELILLERHGLIRFADGHAHLTDAGSAHETG